MGGYRVAGPPVFVVHTDRMVCNEKGCPCMLPNKERHDAQHRAEGRNDWYISTPGVTRTSGPLSERDARAQVDEIVAKGGKPLLLRVVEDYGK